MFRSIPSRGRVHRVHLVNDQREAIGNWHLTGCKCLLPRPPWSRSTVDIRSRCGRQATPCGGWRPIAPSAWRCRPDPVTPAVAGVSNRLSSVVTRGSLRAPDDARSGRCSCSWVAQRGHEGNRVQIATGRGRGLRHQLGCRPAPRRRSGALRPEASRLKGERLVGPAMSQTGRDAFSQLLGRRRAEPDASSPSTTTPPRSSTGSLPSAMIVSVLLTAWTLATGPAPAALVGFGVLVWTFPMVGLGSRSGTGW